MIRLQLDPHQQRLLAQLVGDLPPLDPIEGPWVAGGAVRSVAAYGTLDDVHDVDVFFANIGQRERYTASMEELGHTRILTDILNVRDYRTQWGQVVSLVVGRYQQSAAELIGDFGITACMFVTDGVHVWAHPQAVQHSRERQFVVVNIPWLTKKFVRKYLEDYGFNYDGDPVALVNMSGEWYEGDPEGKDDDNE